MWSITLNTKSGIMMTLAIVCGFVPSLFVTPFAGVWADRYDRKKLIILSDALIAVVTLIMVILYVLELDSIWQLFVILIFRSLGQAIQQPTVSAVIPQLVPESQLTRVNGINTGIQSALMMLAPILAAALYAFTPIEVFFLIDVITAAIAIFILITLIKIPRMELSQEQLAASYFDDIKLAIQYVKSNS